MTIKDTGPIKVAPRGTRAKITVGIHGAEGGTAKREAPELTVADVASFHEFGRGVPQRSFIRGWFDERVRENRELLLSQLKRVAAGKLTLDVAMQRVALKMEASVRQRIRAHIPPPLAPVTIARKGSSTPLIDTGQLVSSIRAKSEVIK